MVFLVADLLWAGGRSVEPSKEGMGGVGTAAAGGFDDACAGFSRMRDARRRCSLTERNRLLSDIGRKVLWIPFRQDEALE